MQSKLKYKIVSYSSQDRDHPVSNLLVKGSAGWESGRFCSYPQQITLQFYSQVHIKQLQFLSNSRKIATQIQILYYSDRQSVDTHFTKYGYISFSDNQRSNYEGKQHKTVMVDISCTYLRFLFRKPHPNKQNFFSQVGMHQINAIGDGLQTISEPILKNPGGSMAEADLEDGTIEDQFIYSKLSILNQMKQRAAEDQNFQEAKRLKQIISSIKNLGYQIRGLEDKKREAVDREEYDKAQKLKTDIQRIRSSAQTIIANISNPLYRARTERVQQQPEPQIQLSKSHVTNRTHRIAQNQFVDQSKQFKDDRPIVVRHDDRVLPTHLAGRQKTQIRDDDPAPELKQNIPSQPQPLTPQQQKQAAPLLQYFDEITIRQYYSSFWQFRLQALKTFINQLKSPSKTKGKDQNALFKIYMQIVSNTLSQKVMQVCSNSMALFADLLTLNKKLHNQSRVHQFQADSDTIMMQIIKRMNDNNVKIRGMADQTFRNMCQSGIFGVVNCSSALLRRGKTKLAPKQLTSKLNTLTYLITLHGLNSHAVSPQSVDFAIECVGNQNMEVRNAAMDLLVEASLNGGEDKVNSSVEKLQANIKEMILKKVGNAKAIKNVDMNTKSKKQGKAVKK